MAIQLLYFPDCPNVDAARDALREALALENRAVAVEEVDVSRSDAPGWTKGWGSPTVLIDGVDVAGEARSGEAMCCRIYKTGAPSIAQLREAIRRAP
jgi:hypothetical protein